MIAVIFELQPREGLANRYFALAAELRETLVKQPGFLSVERFESLTQPGRFLSLSFWTDEAAVRGWRQQMAHRDAQREGRDSVFTDYRLRVAEVLRDYGLHERHQAPADARDALG